MIEYIRGKVTELSPTQAVIEAQGVGFALLVSLNTYSSLQGKEEAKLYVYEAIREDAHLLYGFATKQEREIFVLLLGVPGVGGATARMVLSAFTAGELAEIVRNENIRALKSVKGIGPKAAQRIILDLKDKVAHLFAATSGCTAGGGSGLTGSLDASSREVVNEAVRALSVLGFPPVPTHKVVMEIVKAEGPLPVEALIKRALKML